MGDFNTRPDDKNFRAFYEGHDLFNLIKDKSCFKSASGTCIDLIFTNRKVSFKNTCTIDTGVSDFHRMIFTQLKLTFQKLPPKTIFFCDNKNFDQEKFDKDLILSLMCNINVSSNYAQFSELFEKVLDKHAPLKKRKVRGNQMPFLTKTLRQAIMRRSRLFHTFTRSKKQSDWENFSKQRNHCVKLRNKARKTFLNNLHPNEINKNNFWKTLGAFFSNKSIKQARKIILLEKNEIVSDDREVAEVFMKYFSTITESIDIPKYDPIDKEYLSITDPVFRAIGKYKDHSSIARINSLAKNNTEFNFKHFCPWEIKEKVTSLKNKSSSLQMPVSILKNL